MDVSQKHLKKRKLMKLRTQRKKNGRIMTKILK